MSPLSLVRRVKLPGWAVVALLAAATCGAIFLLGRCSAPDKAAPVEKAVAEASRVVLENKVAADDVAAVEQVNDDAQIRAREKGFSDAIDHPGACAPPAAWQRHACEQLRAQAADRGVPARLPAVCGCAGVGGAPAGGR